ncbi:hypothetical protein Trydic_g11251 [Trypoxylus dichotomus]
MVVRKCDIGDIRQMIELFRTKLFNNVFSDISRIRMCVVMKRHNALTEPATSFILNSATNASQCFTVSFRIDGFTSGQKLNQQNALPVP